jgi:methylated-DNA-[protein]-cysteine S-methyltransferase
MQTPSAARRRVASPIGPLFLTASAKGLTGIFWKKKNAPSSGPASAVRILDRAERELAAYFAGRLRKFTVPLAPAGTPFQKSVWKELRRIPYGRTSSYKEIARRVKNPKAVRAVGTANGANPLCVIVPCHRVIAADGSIGGYSGGLRIKTALLKLESPTRPSKK